MERENYSLFAGATATGEVGGSVYVIGEPDNVRDDDTETGYGVDPIEKWISTTASYVVEIDFGRKVDMAKLEILRETGSAFPETWTAVPSEILSVTLYHNNQWETIVYEEQIPYGGDQGAFARNLYELEHAQSDVEKIRVYFDLEWDPTLADMPYNDSHAILELRVLGPPYEPLYISEGVAIKLESMDGHRVRACFKNIVYGIKLVEPEDPDASHLRIKTADGIKAFAKVKKEE